ncbi:DUF5703 domain-containing protein [Pirellulales bacterium]|nr:DUF5703 domain-containing protein [Pirellulales bacterium]
MYNVVWNSPSENSAGSMPVGGGDIGCNVWVENDELLVYLQRSGIHDEYNGFPKLGRVRVWTSPSILADASEFRQELNLKEGCIEVSAKHSTHGELYFRIWVEVHKPVVRIEARSKQPVTYYAQYESWRTKPRALDQQSRLGERWGWWDIEGWPHPAVLDADHFVQEANGFAAYHVNPNEKLCSKLAYENMGLGSYYGQYPDPLKDLVWGAWLTGSNLVFDSEVTGSYVSTPYVGWRFRTKRAVKRQNFVIVMHTSKCGSGDKWLAELNEKKALATVGIEDAWANNLAWWADFWNRSHFILNPDGPRDDDTTWELGRNYNLFRFMTACNAYGANPTKFNGGLFTFDPRLVGSGGQYHPDWRRWGGGNYTLQNQRWMYWPMLKWGDAEHMLPQFDFFAKTLEVAQLRVRHNYGHDGCLFSEPATVYGLPFPMLYGFESSYLDYRQRAKWDDPGMSRSVAVRNHHTAMLEFSYMVLEYYRYTAEDITKWLPFVKASLDFYDQHYRMRAKYYAATELDRDGKLILFPTSVCEAHYFSTDSVPDVSGLRAVVESVKALPDAWIGKYFGSMASVENLYKSLPELHYDTAKGDTVLPPARSIAYPNLRKNNEIYLMYPMFPFNQIKLGDQEMEYVHNTYKHWGLFEQAAAWDQIVSWTYGNVTYARMGMAEKAAELTTKKLSDGGFRFPAFWGPGYDWAPDHNWGGTGAMGLQEMLMQATDDQIVLLPAWPKDWDVNFKLHAPRQTIVEGKVRGGKVLDLKVTPESRDQDIIIYRDEL